MFPCSPTDIFYHNIFDLVEQLAATAIRIILKYSTLKIQLVSQPTLVRKDVAIELHALVTSKLDYYNELCAELPLRSVWKLQMELNAAARMLTRVDYEDHITPVLVHAH